MARNRSTTSTGTSTQEQQRKSTRQASKKQDNSDEFIAPTSRSSSPEHDHNNGHKSSRKGKQKLQEKTTVEMEYEIATDLFKSNKSDGVNSDKTPGPKQQTPQQKAKKDQQNQVQHDQLEDLHVDPNNQPGNSELQADHTNGKGDDEVQLTIIPERKKLAAVIPAECIPGGNKNKELTVFRKLSKWKGFSHATAIKNKKVNCIKVVFTDQESFDHLLEETFKWTDNEEEVPSKFQSLADLRPRPTVEEKIEEKDRTIQVFDIPLYTKTPKIRCAFEQLGEIEKISTKAVGLYQQAYITYIDKKSVDKLANIWSFNLFRDVVRVTPISLSKECREERQKFSCKLSGLPFGTTAFDLVDFIKDINGKTCFIPRNPTNYALLRYAYVSFKNEEDMEIAMEANHMYKNQQLYWVNSDQLICNKCGSPDHFANKCTKAQQKKKNISVKSAWQTMTAKIQANKQQGKKNKSFAEVVKQGQQQRPNQSQPPQLRNQRQKKNEKTDTGKKLAKEQMQDSLVQQQL